MNPTLLTLVPATGIDLTSYPCFIDASPTMVEGGTPIIGLLALRGDFTDDIQNSVKTLPFYKSIHDYNEDPESGYIVVFMYYDPQWLEDVIHLYTGQPSKISSEYVEMLVKANPSFETELRNTKNQDATPEQIDEHNKNIETKH